MQIGGGQVRRITLPLRNLTLLLRRGLGGDCFRAFPPRFGALLVGDFSLLLGGRPFGDRFRALLLRLGKRALPAGGLPRAESSASARCLS